MEDAYALIESALAAHGALDAAETSRDEGITADTAAWLDALLRELPPSRAARIVAERTGASRDALYERALDRAGGEHG